MTVCEDAAKSAALSCLSAECALPSPNSLIKAQGLGQERAESTSSEYAGGHPGLFHTQVNLSISRDRAVLQQEQAATTPRLERYAAVLAKVWELILVQL